MPAFSDAVIDVGKLIYKRAAAEQGGILSGDNPTHYNASNPIRLWIIQAIIIIGFTQILSLGLAKIRQPRVIAEVVGGILLGPTVMGRIPNFTNTIFPKDSIPLLALLANVGLVLFLFLVGLEIDTSTLKRNVKSAAAISVAGMILPFGLGAAISRPIYNEFIDKSINYGHFLLFVGVAIAITAFPVLCRILTETRLLETRVGVTTLSAGIGNDVVGWILLALVVALVNAGSGLTALWILLTCVGYTIFLLFPVKWGYHWLVRKTGSLESGTPTTFMMTMTLLLIFGSAFFTDVIGVHAIFGGFLAGLIIPHEGGFAIALTEKLEDLVSILLLPLYFTLSGLKTNLGLLDRGTDWGYVILVCTIAFFGKFLGCAITARLTGFNNRESSAIGCLMSCKGLVELIVLNIGLQAGILNQRVFSIFVVHALVLTFMTTPLTVWVYPPHVRTTTWNNGEKNQDASDPESGSLEKSSPEGPDGFKTRFTVVLHKMEYLPAIMSFVQFLQPPSPFLSSSKAEKATAPPAALGVSVDALRLIELTQRTSTVMKSTIADDVIARDSLLSVFRTFGHLNGIPVSSTLSIAQLEDFPETVSAHAKHTHSNMVVIPWSVGTSSVAGGGEVEHITSPSVTHNPFESLFGKNPLQDKAASQQYSQFIRQVFAQCPSDVALYFDRNILSPVHTNGVYGQHIFLPFFGGPDDRLALSFVVQLCSHPAITASVIRITKTAGNELSAPATNDSVDQSKGVSSVPAVDNLAVQSVSGFPDTIYPHATTQTRIHSDMADNIAWDSFASSTGENSARSPTLGDALSRVTFGELSSPTPLANTLERAGEEAKQVTAQNKSMLVVVGRARRLAVESHEAELGVLLAEQGAGQVGTEVRKTIGDVGCAFAISATKASLLVVQACEAASS